MGRLERGSSSLCWFKERLRDIWWDICVAVNTTNIHLIYLFRSLCVYIWVVINMDGSSRSTNDKVPFYFKITVLFSAQQGYTATEILFYFLLSLAFPFLFFFWIKSADITFACYIFEELMCSSLYSLLLSSSLSVFLQTAAFIPTPTSLTSRSVSSALLFNCSFCNEGFHWCFIYLAILIPYQ